MLDAITDKDITAQWQAESPYVTLNPAMWDQAANTWKSYYSNSLQGDGTKYVRRFTYALSRGPVLDGAGANAIRNITNVTRPHRRYHYLDLAGKYYAEKSSQDPEVRLASRSISTASTRRRNIRSGIRATWQVTSRPI